MPRNATDGNRIDQHTPNTGLWMVEDVANYLRCSKDAVYRMVERREIPHTRIFRRKGLRFRPAEIEECLRSQHCPHAKGS